MNQQDIIPRIGMLAIVRKRRGIITEVHDYAGKDSEVLHLVRLDYKDDLSPEKEDFIWEIEASKTLLNPNELPQFNSSPMYSDDYFSLLRSARWSAIHPYIDPDGHGPLERLPVSAPFHGAMEVEDYQLFPLLKALRMPRVNLLIADDVGLGKTIEAGLILSELLIRRRINRILILTPASLRIQWRDEMWEKFSLPFDVVDRDSTMKLKRSLGIDANPWRFSNRIISSYHYLKQPDILEQFFSASRLDEQRQRLPWDLLIVDEVHNLMPATMREDSQLCKMLRIISPQFEHKLYLTATPHNGYTSSFTGLLELLDPVRFNQKDELSDIEKERIKQVVIRRLKREINERSDSPKFCTRMPPQAILLDQYFSGQELKLIAAFDAFKIKVRSIIQNSPKRRRVAGTFAIEILGKRLLSGPMTFIDSWQRCKLGMQEDAVADDNDVVIAGNSIKEDLSDDRETQERSSSAVTVIGSWLKTFTGLVQSEIEAIDTAVNELGVDINRTIIQQNPKHDGRFEAFLSMIEKNLLTDNNWLEDERLVVFTEYKTTLDYLVRRLRRKYPDNEGRIRFLFGGMDDLDREEIKTSFNDPHSDVRILIATDAASEGLNLQATARYMLHYDCPWNPSRLEQRNGRLDRHGQARDVHIFHFDSEQDSDLKFISYLIKKVDNIREDLGAVGELFDEITHRRLINGDEISQVQNDLENGIRNAQGKFDINADNSVRIEIDETDGNQLDQYLKSVSEEIDYNPESGRTTLNTAMSLNTGKSQLSGVDELGRFDLNSPFPPAWNDTIDDTIRLKTSSKELGPTPKLTFNLEAFRKEINGRKIFQPRVDTRLLHLGHPLMKKAIGSLTRRRFPGQYAVSRWAVRYGIIPESTDALLILHLEEMAVNDLRETFHHWISSHRLPFHNGDLNNPLEHKTACELGDSKPCDEPEIVSRARDIISDCEIDLQQFIKEYQKNLTRNLIAQLDIDREIVKKEESERFQSRQGELSVMIQQNTITNLEKQIAKIRVDMNQMSLLDESYRLEQMEKSLEEKQAEIARRTHHYDELREQLSRERERIINKVIPNRFRLNGQAQVFPVALEVWFPIPEGSAQ